MSPRFYNILICASLQHVYHMTNVPNVVGSPVVVYIPTHCTLLHSMYDLEDTQMNMNITLIQKLMIYKFELSHNTMEATKNIYVKYKRFSWLQCWNQKVQEILLGLQAMIRQSKVGLKLWILKLYSKSYIQKVSGELGISQSTVVHHLHNFSKSIQNC